MAKILIFNPAFEDATKLWHPWMFKLADIIKAAGHTPVLLSADQDTVSNMLNALADPEVRAMAGHGHGNATTFTGQNYDILFTVCRYNAGLIKTRNFSPVSCLIGNELLPDMVQKGLGCGLGMLKEYVFYWGGADPLQDTILQNFTLSEFEYWKALVNGYTHGGSWEKAKAAYLDRANRIGCVPVSEALKQDAMMRSVFGDRNWMLAAAPSTPPPAPPAPPPTPPAPGEETWEIIPLGPIRVKIRKIA